MTRSLPAQRKRILSDLAQAVLDFDPNAAVKSANEAINSGIDPSEAIEDGISKGLRKVGEMYEKMELFLPDLIAAADTAKAGLSVLITHVSERSRHFLGRVLIGTVEGDIHDIGKNIVVSMLNAAGFEVYDLGVDVPTDNFIEKAKSLKPDIIGISALLTVTLPKQKDIIEALTRAGIRDRIKVMVGGAAVTPEWARQIGADDYAANAAEAVRRAKEIVSDRGIG